jgi:hypothetical protein
VPEPLERRSAERAEGKLARQLLTAGRAARHLLNLRWEREPLQSTSRPHHPWAAALLAGLAPEYPFYTAVVASLGALVLMMRRGRSSVTSMASELAEPVDTRRGVPVAA